MTMLYSMLCDMFTYVHVKNTRGGTRGFPSVSPKNRLDMQKCMRFRVVS